MGRLERTRDGFEFLYVNAVKTALWHGFRPLPAFPNLEIRYRSSMLPPLFENRVMKGGRADRLAYMTRLGLSPTRSEPLSELARSGGRRATDRLAVFAPFLRSPQGLIGTFWTECRRYFPRTDLSPNSLLRVVRVSAAELALDTASGSRVGTIPDHLSRQLCKNNVDAEAVKISVVRLNSMSAPEHHRLLCRMVLPPRAKGLFEGEAFRPLVEGFSPVHSV